MEISTEGNVTLTKAEALCLAAHASTDDTRPHLAGVWIEPHLLRAWATDGHRAVMGRRVGGCFLGRPAAVMVPRAKLLDACRMARKASDRVIVYVGPARGSEDGSRVLGAGNVVGIQAVAEDGTVRGSTHCTVDPAAEPVPIDQVLYVPDGPPQAPASAFGVNPGLLAESLTTLGKAAGNAFVDVRPGPDPLAPIAIRVVADNATEWTAAVMPTRTGSELECDIDNVVAHAAAQVRKAYGDAAAAAFDRAAADAAGRALPAAGETTETEPTTKPKRRGGGRRKKAA